MVYYAPICSLIFFEKGSAMKKSLLRGNFGLLCFILCTCLTSLSSSAQSFDVVHSEKERDMKVLSLVTIKKNDTCMGVTKLSLQECMELGEKFGRPTELFIRGDGKQTFIVPLYVGEQIAFVRYMEGPDVRVKYILSKKR